MRRWISLMLWMVIASTLMGGSPAPVIPLPPQALEGGNEICEPLQDDLTPAQEQAMWENIQRNVKDLQSRGILVEPNTDLAVTYDFPLQLAPGLPDYAGYKVSAFADHNPTTGQVLDYYGGSRTYDGHRGTDYALTPFSWNKVDAGEVQVIAAAAGTIAYYANVDPTDTNCGTSSGDPWNYVALLHADGRLTIYGHMRYNSLTSKGIGQSVAQGEYLGTVASSGNSSGPHLHFEVRYGSFSNAEWLDPYAGPNSQPESLWANQIPYFDSAINKLSTHSLPPGSPDPCLPSILNLEDGFTTPDRIYFYAYFRDYQSVLPTQLKIYRPDASLYSSWQYAPGGNFFYASWSQGWVFDFSSGDPSGTWRFEATYNDQVYNAFFNVNSPLTTAVTSPNGGEQWNRQLTHLVMWTDNYGGAVNIALFQDGIYAAAVAYNTPSDGEFLWEPTTVPDPGSGYAIRVSSVINPAIYDESDASFTFNDGTLVARDDMVLTLINIPVTIDVLINDESPNHDPLTITALGQPISGGASLENAHIIYTPPLDFIGTDVFTYTVSSGFGNATATVTVIIASEVFKLSLPLTRR